MSRRRLWDLIPMRNEINFIVEIDEHGIYQSYADGHSILVFGNTEKELLANIHDALVALFGQPVPAPRITLT